MTQIEITIREYEVSQMTGVRLFEKGKKIERIFNIDDKIRFVNPISDPSKEVKIRLLEELLDYLRNQ